MTRTSFTLDTLAKGLRVLETLEAAFSLTEIARHLRESQTVVIHLLKTLAEHGYVHQDAATKRYTPGLRLGETTRRAS